MPTEKLNHSALSLSHRQAKSRGRRPAEMAASIPAHTHAPCMDICSSRFAEADAPSLTCSYIGYVTIRDVRIVRRGRESGREEEQVPGLHADRWDSNLVMTLLLAQHSPDSTPQQCATKAGLDERASDFRIWPHVSAGLYGIRDATCKMLGACSPEARQRVWPDTDRKWNHAIARGVNMSTHTRCAGVNQERPTHC